MEVVILPSGAEVGVLAARKIRHLVNRKPDAVLGLATGSSPLAIYAALAAHVRDGSLDTSRVSGFALDEYVGIPVEHPESYAAVIAREVTAPLHLDPARVQVPDGRAADVEAACERYEDAIRAAGGVDLQILGIGANGHVGFNEPTSSFASRTRIKTLHRTHPVRQRALLRHARRRPDALPHPGARHDLRRARAAARGAGPAEGRGRRRRRRGPADQHLPGVGAAAATAASPSWSTRPRPPTCSSPTTTAGPTRTSRPGSSSDHRLTLNLRTGPTRVSRASRPGRAAPAARRSRPRPAARRRRPARAAPAGPARPGPPRAPASMALRTSACTRG